MKGSPNISPDRAVLLGEESHVHLVVIESSSTCPVVLVDSEAEPKVIERINRTRPHQAPPRWNCG
jgi:hypothetical protein